MNATADALMGIFGMKRVKPRECRCCRQEYMPTRTTQKTCGQYECNLSVALAVAAKRAAKREKAAKQLERKETKARKEKLKTRSDYAKDAQDAFNAFIRYRDMVAGHGCISCGTKKPDIQYAAGHYRTVGAAPHLRFNEDNVHLQCNHNCNSKKAGNVVEYRIRLVKRIGPDRVEALESDNTSKHYSIDDLKAITKLYRAKLRELKEENK